MDSADKFLFYTMIPTMLGMLAISMTAGVAFELTAILIVVYVCLFVGICSNVRLTSINKVFREPPNRVWIAILSIFSLDVYLIIGFTQIDISVRGWTFILLGVLPNFLVILAGFIGMLFIPKSSTKISRVNFWTAYTEPLVVTFSVAFISAILMYFMASHNLSPTHNDIILKLNNKEIATFTKTESGILSSHGYTLVNTGTEPSILQQQFYLLVIGLLGWPTFVKFAVAIVNELFALRTTYSKSVDTQISGKPVFSSKNNIVKIIGGYKDNNKFEIIFSNEKPNLQPKNTKKQGFSSATSKDGLSWKSKPWYFKKPANIRSGYISSIKRFAWDDQGEPRSIYISEHVVDGVQRVEINDPSEGLFPHIIPTLEVSEPGGVQLPLSDLLIVKHESHIFYGFTISGCRKKLLFVISNDLKTWDVISVVKISKENECINNIKALKISGKYYLLADISFHAQKKYSRSTYLYEIDSFVSDSIAGSVARIEGNRLLLLGNGELGEAIVLDGESNEILRIIQDSQNNRAISSRLHRVEVNDYKAVSVPILPASANSNKYTDWQIIESYDFSLFPQKLVPLGGNNPIVFDVEFENSIDCNILLKLSSNKEDSVNWCSIQINLEESMVRVNSMGDIVSGTEHDGIKIPRQLLISPLEVRVFYDAGSLDLFINGYYLCQILSEKNNWETAFLGSSSQKVRVFISSIS